MARINKKRLCINKGKWIKGLSDESKIAIFIIIKKLHTKFHNSFNNNKKMFGDVPIFCQGYRFIPLEYTVYKCCVVILDSVKDHILMYFNCQFYNDV